MSDDIIIGHADRRPPLRVFWDRESPGPGIRATTAHDSVALAEGALRLAETAGPENPLLDVAERELATALEGVLRARSQRSAGSNVFQLAGSAEPHGRPAEGL